jgi:AcrR family transcriptional regulator
MKKNIIKRKNRIIIEAIDLLDESGIQGLTTKEIAKRQGITEPAIYRQFDSKKQIILSVLEEFSKYDHTIRSTLLQQPMRFEEKIAFYVNSYISYYESYPQISVIMFSADVYRYDEETFSFMKEVLDSREVFLKEIVRKAIEEGEVKRDSDPEEIADSIQGLIWWYTFKWRIIDPGMSLKKTIQDRLKTLITGIINK